VSLRVTRTWPIRIGFDPGAILERAATGERAAACDLRRNDIRRDDVRRTCAQLTILMLEPMLPWEIVWILGSEIEIAWHRGGTAA
jgi:hypothetical protein